VAAFQKASFMKILLIESDGAFAQEISAAIEAHGVEVRVTFDGKEALELARAEHPDLIVLCVELPKMSGYSVCNKLKKDDQLKAIPLVIMSGEATPETFEQHRKLKTRAEGYLIKPFAPAALVELIGTLVPLPAEAPVVSSDEIVTLDGIELQPDQEPQVTQDLGGARPGAPEDEDLKLLDEAFESLAVEDPGTAGVRAPERPAPAAETPPPPEDGGTDIDRLGAEADAALAELNLEEPVDGDLESAAGLLDGAPPAAEVLEAPAAAGPPPVAPGEPSRDADGELERLRAELHAARAAEASQASELADLKARLASAEGELEAHRSHALASAEEVRAVREGDLHAADERTQAAEARATEALAGLRRAEEALAKAEGQARAAEERTRAAEEELRQGAEGAQAAEARASAALQRATDAEARAGAAVDRAAEAEARAAAAGRRADEAEARAGAAEAESAELRRRAEESLQASSLKAAEAEQARQRAEALAQELDSAQARMKAHEGELTSLRAELDQSRAELTAIKAEAEGFRAEAERLITDLRRRVSELESQNAKHEERVVKAYQKIKGDEKIREKTRKALGIALQLLEERSGAAQPSEVQPRRE